MINANLNINGARKTLGFPTADLLLLFDGTILDDGGTKYFVDKKQGKNFLITNYDFPTDWTVGFPYKSAATISAPVGDAELIAADFNNFLYDSGGTPNEIPVVSLFQDIDYEHRFFCKHAPQVLDSNGVEVYEPRVLRWNFYSTVQADNNLTLCQNYFNVPTEELANVKWINDSGLDTNSGTKLLPWLTLQKGNNSATVNDTVYIKSGLFDEVDRLLLNKILKYKSLGLVEITSSGTTYTVLNQTTGALSMDGFIFNGEDNTTNVFYFLNDSTQLTRSLIKNAGTYNVFINTAEDLTLKNLIILGSKYFYFNTNITLDTCYSENYFGVMQGAITGIELKNSKFKVDTLLNFLSITKDIPIVIKGNYFNIVSAPILVVLAATASTENFIFEDNEALVTSVDSQMLQLQETGNNISVVRNKITSNSGKTFLFQDVDSITCNSNIITSLFDTSIFVYNLKATSTIVEVSNNKVITKFDSVGKNIRVGNEDSGVGDDSMTSILISNNYLRGNKYYSPSNSVTTHLLLLGFQSVPSIIKYNVFEYGGMVVLKASSGDYSGCKFHNNIIKNNQEYGLYLKSVNGVNIIGNTFIENGNNELYYTENLGGDGTENSIVKNNIIINTTGLLVNFLTASCAVNHTFDHNIYYSPLEKPFSIDGVTKSWVEWKSLGYDEHSILITSEEEMKALFVDYDNGDYRLSPNSVAIGNGVDLGATYKTGLDASTDWGSDTELPSVVTKDQSGSWDIGAYVS